MTREEAIEAIKEARFDINTKINGTTRFSQALEIALKALEQETCDDCVSRQEVLDMMQMRMGGKELYKAVYDLPPVTPQPKTGYCKDCKYFEYDSVAKVDGIPLIVAHEICKRWGGGCKTKEDGYCFLFETQERSDKERQNKDVLEGRRATK